MTIAPARFAQVAIHSVAEGDSYSISSSRGSDLTTQSADNDQVAALCKSTDINGKHDRIDPLFEVKSIAVSPLQNHSSDPSQDFFAETLTEAFISELAGNRQLKVFPGSVLRNPGSGGELHLTSLVEGSVLRLGNQMRIDVQLLHLPTRVQMWSQTYDRGLDEILAVTAEISAAIALQTRANVPSREQMQFHRALPVEPEAYDCYLRGRFYTQHQNKADNETATLAFERAIAIDPTFALAHAELAQTYVWKTLSFRSS